MLSKDDVTHLADLARIKLSDEEKERYVKDLGGILDYVSEISEVVTDDVGLVPSRGISWRTLR
jgi:aspartyl-tRNA(Asn)/glutamyl-tRNA(Gln) amidotransferase subunit C